MRVQYCLVAALLAGAMLPVPGMAAAADSELRLASYGAVESFDPDAAADEAGVAARDAVYDGLVAYEPGKTRITGRVAQSWTVSPDGLTYTFKLRSGVTFHDGTPLDSDAVKASLVRRMASAHPPRRLDGIAEVATPDALTVVVRLNQRQPWLLDTLAGAWGPKILSPAALAAQGSPEAAAAWLRTHDAGSGPFQVAQVTQGGLRLERFGGYWGTAPWFAAISVAALPDAAAQALRLQAGMLDAVANVYPPASLDRLPSAFRVTALSGLNMIVGVVNPLLALTNDDARRAVLTAMHPKWWLPEIYGAYGSPATTLFPADMIETLEPLELPSDLVVARRLVPRAGGVSLTVGYRTSQADVLRGPVEVLVSNLRALGVVADAVLVPDAAVARYARQPTAGPDILVVCTAPGEATPRAQAQTYYLGSGPGNVFGLIDPNASRLAREADAITDRNDALKQYLLAGDQLFASGGFVPLANIKGIVVHRDYLTGFATRPGFPVGNFDYALLAESE